jgi:beta-lactamase class D
MNRSFCLNEGIVRKFWVLILFFLPIQVFAEDEEIAKIFAQYGVEGTIIISTLTSNQKFTHNDMRANKRFSPASTFEIPNTLISLESKAILGKDDLFKWDGTQYDFPDWNHDQTLASAFKVSCVWCYQALAKRVGTERYENYLNVLGYGELHKPFEVTMFWLNDSLKISAIEQLEFLKKLYQRTLPFRSNAYETLKEIMQVENAQFYVICKNRLDSKIESSNWLVCWLYGNPQGSLAICFKLGHSKCKRFDTT